MSRLNPIETASLSADDTYTNPAIYHGQYAMRIRGTWSGTITLQRSDDGGTNWDDIEQFSTNQLRVVLEPSVSGGTWRIGFKSGEHSSGTAEVRLG